MVSENSKEVSEGGGGGGGGGSKGVFRQYLAASITSLSVVILGTALGWPSPVLRNMETTGYPFRMTNDEISWMVSLLYFGNLLSPIPSGYLMDYFGRKNSLLVMGVIPLSAWIITLYANHPYMLYVSRFMSGLWSGVVGTIAPMYLAEISEPRVRGALSTFFQMMTNIGVQLEYIIGSFVSYDLLASLSAGLPIVFLVTFWYMPESPHWLYMKGNKGKALKNLAWLRHASNTSDVKEEAQSLEHSVQEETKNKKSFKDLFATRGNRKALLIVELLAFFQRCSGVSALMAYTSTTLPEKGAGILDPNDCVTVIGMVWVVSVFVATLLVDRLGRRPLLLTSCLGSGIAMFTAGVWFYLDSNTDLDVSEYYWIPFASFVLYGLFFSIGMGPIASTVQGECFPANIKGLASAITSIVLALTSFVFNKIYHSIAEYFGMYLNYWIFTVSCICCLIFVQLYVIETKGKTLHEIHEELNNKKVKKNTAQLTSNA